MKAYAYKETESCTNYSATPVTFYVLRYSWQTLAKTGVSQITTTDLSSFERILIEEASKGVQIEKSRLPLLMRRSFSERATFDNNVPPSGRVEVTREPLEKAA